MSGHYFVTAPIYYANGAPHIGHTYTTILADTLVRWHRLHGRTAFSVSGTDEHGEKMVEVAAKNGETPRQLVDRISPLFVAAWNDLGIHPSAFVRTTSERHVRNVQALLQRVHDAGWIELRTYAGDYCVGCERFVTERDLVNGVCPDHERKPERRNETNYFFLMSRAFDWLRAHIDAHPDFIRPERYRNEVLGMLRDASGLGDLSISRPKTRLDWGIELPFDRDHVCYVWFDALITYLTGAGFDGEKAIDAQSGEFDARWAAAEHLIAKDILKPHAIFWPIMLRAIGLAPPKHLNVHGYWNVDARKVSKSLGNMIAPKLLRDRYGFEQARYFLLREMSFGNDANFTEEALVERVNADLANNLGNLLSRTLNLVEKNCAAKVPEPDSRVEPAALDSAWRKALGVLAAWDGDVRFHLALEAIVELSTAANRYIDECAPWKAARVPGSEGAVRTCLYWSCQALHRLGRLLAPFLPNASREILSRLGASEPTDYPSLSELLPEHVRAVAPGTPIAKGAPLFPRLAPPAPAA
ncbi:MAG: methionine--tRNA ligase [Deltaproteobacteria bacterium]|nr:methionine--tRNA ligase [Deltaproteobacteria bacterium]